MKPRTSKKISIVPQIKKFKQMIKKKKQEIKNRPVSKNLPQKLSKNSPQKPQKRKNELPLPYQPKKKKIDSAIDSTILRKQTDELQIGSEAQRKTLPLITADSNNFKFFTEDKCNNCKMKFLTNPTKINHVNIFRNKRNVVHVPTSVFDINKHMLIICMNEFCCLSFRTLDSYYEHIANEHNQLPTDTVPVYQNPNMKTYSELACRMCQGEFTNKYSLKKHEEKCTGSVLFFCELCSYTNADFDEIIKHGKNTHQKSNEFDILEEFFGNENNNSKKKIKNSSTIYKTYTKIFNNEYTSMTEALTRDNLKQMFKIIKNTKVKKEDFCFALCTPVIISKTSEYGIQYRQRYFRTKNIRAGSRQSIISSLNASKLSLLLQAEHLEETGSGWVVQHCRRLDLIITGLNGVSFFILKKNVSSVNYIMFT